MGPRPGEKIIEDVVDLDEERLPSGHPSIVVSRPPAPDRAALRMTLRELEELAVAGRHEDLAARMKTLAARSLVAPVVVLEQS